MNIFHARRWVSAGAALALILTVSACSAPPWETAVNTATPPTSTSTSKPAEITTVVNELASGSTEHTLTAGNITMVVTYYSDLTMDKWLPEANKPLTISMSAELTNDEGQKIYLAGVSVAAEVSGPNGILASPGALTDRSNINPGYLVKAPYSYIQTFVIPAVDRQSTSIKLSIVYDLLLQTTPTSGEFAKQTASDTLSIGLAHPAE